MKKLIVGFSKLTKQEKINWLVDEYLDGEVSYKNMIEQYWNDDAELQKLHDEFSENTISNYYMPFGVAPNFLIDGKLRTLPMAIEESSVVAAASKAGKFWSERGGFKTQILGKEKLGHTHFIFEGDKEKLFRFFELDLKNKILEATEGITQNMRKRGGGILKIELLDQTHLIENYYQLKLSFDTKDSMGANFINSCLERCGKTLQEEIFNSSLFDEKEKSSLQVVMNILSNYTPDCLVRAEVSCPVEQLTIDKNIPAMEFAKKFEQAIRIAEVDVYRATTHNKGIMNGVDAVVIATGNDFRATEACVYAYASRNGKYESLSHCEVKDGVFRFWIDLPISVGVIGGLTNIHPLVKFSLALLGNPSSEELMSILAASGLAQNFGAVSSLVTTGIQKGHMKMHLNNILNQLGATDEEKKYFENYFQDKTINHHEVIAEFNKYKNK